MSSTTSTIEALVNRVGGVAVPFSIKLPDGEKRNLGEGNPEFHVGLRNEKAMRALRSLDEADIAEAYLAGDIDIEGDMLKPFALRAHLDDSHPLVLAWRFIQPLLFGQVYTNKRAISSHYNADPKLFLSFLDPIFRPTAKACTLTTMSRSRPRCSGNSTGRSSNAGSARARRCSR